MPQQNVIFDAFITYFDIPQNNTKSIKPSLSCNKVTYMYNNEYSNSSNQQKHRFSENIKESTPSFMDRLTKLRLSRICFQFKNQEVSKFGKIDCKKWLLL